MYIAHIHDVFVIQIWLVQVYPGVLVPVFMCVAVLCKCENSLHNSAAIYCPVWANQRQIIKLLASLWVKCYKCWFYLKAWQIWWRLSRNNGHDNALKYMEVLIDSDMCSMLLSKCTEAIPWNRWCYASVLVLLLLQSQRIINPQNMFLLFSI